MFKTVSNFKRRFVRACSRGEKARAVLAESLLCATLMSAGNIPCFHSEFRRSIPLFRQIFSRTVSDGTIIFLLVPGKTTTFHDTTTCGETAFAASFAGLSGRVVVPCRAAN